MKVTLEKIAIGGWQAGDWSPDSATTQFVDLYQCAYELGFRVFDTAPSYGKGQSEKVLGEAIAGQRTDVILCTKFAPHHSKRSNCLRSLEQSLSNLQTDYIDILFQHWPSRECAPDQTIEMLCGFREEGLIRKVGVSNWDMDQLGNCTLSSEIDCFQNVLNPCWGKEYQSLSSDGDFQGKKLFAASPLVQGLPLTHRALSESDVRQKNIFAGSAVPDSLIKLQAALGSLSTMERIATLLHWGARKHPHYHPIVGVSSRTQLEALSEVPKIDMKPLMSEAVRNLDKLFQQQLTDPVLAETPSMWNWHPLKESLPSLLQKNSK